MYARTETPGTRRRQRPRDALADARRAGVVRRVHAGRRPDYTASTTANVISTAGDAALTVSDPGHLTNGAFSLPEPLQVRLQQGDLDRARSSNDAVTIAFKQHIGATDAAAHRRLLEDAHVHVVDHDARRVGPMSFEVAGSDYDRFMGRYSRLLAPQLADFAGVASGQRVIDVGSGPGALTEVLVARLGPRRGRRGRPVGAVHRRAARAAAGRRGRAGARGGAAVRRRRLRRRARAARRALHEGRGRGRARDGAGHPAGGVIAASVWDLAGDRTPLSVLWRAVRELDPDVARRVRPAGAREGALAELLRAGRPDPDRVDRARGSVQARDVRGVVGPVRARRRARGPVRRLARRQTSRGRARALPRAPA